MTYNAQKLRFEVIHSNARPSLAKPKPSFPAARTRTKVAQADAEPSWFEVMAEQWIITFVASQP